MPNDPVIEASENLKFGPFNVSYPGLEEQAQKAGLLDKVNKWELIFDFTKLVKDTEDVHEQLPPADWKFEKRSIEGVEGESNIVFEYPNRYGGEGTDDKPQSTEAHGLQAFDIKTG